MFEDGSNLVSSFQSSDVQFSRMNSKRYVELEHFLMHFSNESYLVDPASGDKLMSKMSICSGLPDIANFSNKPYRIFRIDLSNKPIFPVFF